MLSKRIINPFGFTSTILLEDWLLAIIAFGIPFSIKLGNTLLVLSFLFAIYVLITNRKATVISLFCFPFIFPMVFFLIILISSLFSRDIGSGFKQVEKNLLLILIPVTINALQGNRKVNQTFLLGVFTSATFVSTAILLITSVIRFINGSTVNTLFFHKFGSFFDLHPVYIAISVSVSIFFITDRYLRTINRSTLRFLPILLFFYGILILCASKAILISFIVLHIIHLLIILKGKNKYLSIVILNLFLILIVTTVNLDRFKEGFHFDITQFKPTQNIDEAKIFSNIEKTNISDLELRYIMLNIGLYHIWVEEKFFFGYGIGDVQHYTDYHYMIYNLAPGWYEGYNLHNQYLQILVSFGFFVLIFFCYYLFFSFKTAIQSGNLIYLLFLVLMTMVFLVESILSRNKGIIIFYFFNTLFIMKELNENSHIRNSRNTQ